MENAHIFTSYTFLVRFVVMGYRELSIGPLSLRKKPLESVKGTSCYKSSEWPLDSKRLVSVFFFECYTSNF